MSFDSANYQICTIQLSWADLLAQIPKIKIQDGAFAGLYIHLLLGVERVLVVDGLIGYKRTLNLKKNTR